MLVEFVIAGTIVFLILVIFNFFLLIHINRRNLLHQKELLTATFEAQEDEQRRIGSDIHDDIGPLLSTVKLYLTKLRYSKTDDNRLEQIRFLGTQLDDVTQRVRDIARNKVPTVLTEHGLIKAISHLGQQIDQSGQVEVKLHNKLPEGFRLEEKAELNLYRIVQELINNALKHAKARQLNIRLDKKENTLYISVEDDGVGIPAARLKEVRSGIGLKNIEARATLLDADFEVKSQEDMGTEMILTVPINEKIISPQPSELVPVVK